MKRILILYTGGTIGMDYTDNGLAVISGLFASQLQMLAPVNNLTQKVDECEGYPLGQHLLSPTATFSDVGLDLIEFEQLIDSSDITLSYWQQIINHIADNASFYDGFIVVHGTDTMAYTASILSFALHGLNKPVILTGSQLPLVHRRSDGWNNLVDAIYAAMQPDLYEVAIAFNHRLFRGCRAQKVSTNSFLGFDSVDEAPLASFGIEISWYKKLWRAKTDSIFVPITLKSTQILDLVLHPGYTTDFIAHTFNTTTSQCIILQTYGSGTIAMHHDELIQSIKNATSRGVIVINITQVIEGRVDNMYGNSRLCGLGVISGCDMTPEAALAKMTVLFSKYNDIEVIKKAITRDLIGELTENS